MNEDDEDMAVDVSNDVARELAAQEAAAEEAGEEEEVLEGQADEEGDEDDNADAEHRSATEVPPVKKKKKQTADERIAELVQRAKDAEKVAFDAEMQLIEHQKATAVPQKTPEPPKKPSPADYVYGEADSDYLDAMVDYRVETKLATQRTEFEASKKAESEAATQQLYADKVKDVMAAGKKVHKDFDEVVGSVTFDGLLARLVVDSEAPVDIAYHLSNNASELLKITRADPAERMRLIGRLEGKFSATSAVRKRTKAPKPLGQGRTALTGEEAQYGPSNQDDFDKALFG